MIAVQGELVIGVFWGVVVFGRGINQCLLFSYF